MRPALTAPVAPAVPVAPASSPAEARRWQVAHPPPAYPWVCGECGQRRNTSLGACARCGHHRVVSAYGAPPEPVRPARRTVSRRRALGESARRLLAGAPAETEELARMSLLPLLLSATAATAGTVLFRAVDSPLPLLLASLFVLLGMALAFRYGRAAATTLPRWDMTTWGEIGWSLRFGRVRLLLLGLGAAAATTLALLLTLTRSEGGALHLALWAASAVLVGAWFWRRESLAALWAALSAGTQRPWLLGTLLPALLVTAAYCAVTVPHLTEWRYAAIGDEYSFYLGAVALFETGPERVFSQNGVFAQHPQFNSVYKYVVMTVFGGDHFGWKMSGVVSVVTATLGVWFLGGMLFGRWTGVLAAAIFASSHYLMGLMHGGYNHMDSLPWMVWSVGVFVAGVRRRSPLLLYLAGTLVGLGLYFHYSARLTGVVLLLFALTWARPRDVLRMWPLGLGFLVVAAPTALVAGTELWTKMASESLGSYSRDVSGPVLPRLAWNFVHNLPAFFRIGHVGHYVSGALADPLAGTLMAVGIGTAAGAARRPGPRLLLIWTVVYFVMTGLLSPYPHAAVTRLYPLVAPLSLAAATAARPLLSAAATALWPLLGRLGPAAGTALLVALLFGLNVHQLRDVTHGRYHYTREAMAIGAQRNERCAGDERGGWFVGEDPRAVLGLALYSYTRSQPGAGWTVSLEWPPTGPEPRCLILMRPGRVGVTVDELQRMYPEGEFYTMNAPSGLGRMEFYRTRVER